MKSKLLFISALAAILAGGCAVGPDYHPPQASASAHWTEPLGNGETNAPALLGAWWTNFHDPELNSLIGRAVRSNLDLQIAEARVRAARAEKQMTYADLWPSADLSGSYGRSLESMHQPLIGSLPAQVRRQVHFENNVYQAGFDASWEIDVFGGKRRAVQSASAQLAATEYESKYVLLTLLGDVARNYMDVRAYQRRLVIARENIKAQEQGLAIAQDRFGHGVASDLDVEQAATLLTTTRAVVPALEAAVETSFHRLGVLLGLEPGALIAELSGGQPIPAAPPSVPVGLPSDLLLRRPDVRQTERQLAAATANIGVAKADLFPKFFLTGAGGLESTSASDWFSPGSRFWSVGPTMTWRIFDAGKIRANIRVQNALQEQALAAYEETTLTAFEDVENSLVAYAKEQTRRDSLADSVLTSQKSLDLATSLYKSGLTDFVNVLEAESALYQAQDALAQSDRDISTDVVALYKSLGGGWDAIETTASLGVTKPPAYAAK
jgi:NodT family efflux transporter outer membrane factor (OMF) lipoprotein